MTEESTPAIPLDAHPDPAVAYTVSNGDPVVTAVNDAFEATFADAPTGSPVSAVFEQFGIVESPSTADPLTPLVDGDAAVVYLDDFGELEARLARVVPADGDSGFVVFAPLEAVLGVAEAAGVDQVASVLSHDLRNPLDVAKAHLRAARETGESEHFDSVADAHERMRTIIRDVLTLARGRDAVTPEAGTSLESAVDDGWQSVDTDNATLERPDTLPTTTADADRLRRLFENLFRNAVEHGSTSPDSQARQDAVEHGSTGSQNATRSDDAVEHGATNDQAASEPDFGGPVTVEVGALEDGFYVADDGPGIPPEERENVFKPGHSTNTGGTGLGLAIVDRIVAAHGWDLRLTAAAGGGARFEVRF